MNNNIYEQSIKETSGENPGETNQAQDALADGEKNSIHNTLFQKLKICNDKKKALIIALAIIVGIIAVIVGIHVYSNGFWGRIVDQMLDEYPYANNARASDGSYLEIDTNPYNKDYDELTAVQAATFYQEQEDSLYGVKFVNEKLGFPDSVFEKMLTTTSLMGRQSEEISKFRVSWTYHPDRGLEVMYEKK